VALEREVLEELGVKIDLANVFLFGVHYFVMNEKHNIDVLYWVKDVVAFDNLDDVQNSSHAFERESCDRVALDKLRSVFKPMYILEDIEACHGDVNWDAKVFGLDL